MADPTGLSGMALAAAGRIYAGYNVPAPGANTNIFTAKRPSRRATRWRVFVVLATGSVFNYRVTDGTNAFTVGLNGSTALNAGDAYSFEFDVENSTDGSESGTALTYSLQVETDGVIRQLIVTEVTGPG